MIRTIFIGLCLACLCTSCCTDTNEENAAVAEKIIAMEKAALERWGNGDPGGFLEIIADDYSYFDPLLTKRLDGIDAIREYYAPITSTVRTSRFDMPNARVQIYGDSATLTFNLYSYNKANGVETLSAKWNSTETYAKIDGEWKLIHSHWSIIEPFKVLQDRMRQFEDSQEDTAEGQ